jgi:hypothetical protein
MSAPRPTAWRYGAEISPDSASRASRKGSPLPRITEVADQPRAVIKVTLRQGLGDELVLAEK